MADDMENYIMLGLLVVGGYVLYKGFKGVATPLTPQTFAGVVEGGTGASVRRSTLRGDNAQFVTLNNNTTYRIPDADVSQFNVAQKLLLAFDKIIPGDYLTRSVFEGSFT